MELCFVAVMNVAEVPTGEDKSGEQGLVQVTICDLYREKVPGVWCSVSLPGCYWLKRLRKLAPATSQFIRHAIAVELHTLKQTQKLLSQYCPSPKVNELPNRS